MRGEVVRRTCQAEGALAVHVMCTWSESRSGHLNAGRFPCLNGTAQPASH